MKSWTLPVQQDIISGDHYIQLNDDILAESGFKIGDDLSWIDNKDGSFTLAKQKELDDIYVVSTVSTFVVRYAVRAKSLQDALDHVAGRANDSDFKELSQNHTGYDVIDGSKHTPEEYLDRFDDENTYLQSWSDAQKFNMINEIDREADI